MTAVPKPTLANVFTDTGRFVGVVLARGLAGFEVLSGRRGQHWVVRPGFYGAPRRATGPISRGLLYRQLCALAYNGSGSGGLRWHRRRHRGHLRPCCKSRL